jgi:hypothetical protein
MNSSELVILLVGDNQDDVDLALHATSRSTSMSFAIRSTPSVSTGWSSISLRS